MIILNDNLFNPDIDECSNNNGGCDQVCYNFPGYYQCICFKTYILNADNNICERILKQPIKLTSL